MKKTLFVLCAFLLVYFQASAQRFPIIVIPQVNSPAPVYFYNYADATTLNSPLRVQLILNDITISDRQIALRIAFQGNGLSFRSTDVVVGAAPLFISGGEPLRLTNVELAPYFELQNIQGINPNVYGQVIPEGSYQFCFEVFDFMTGNRLSELTCANTYIFRNDPPLLNLPLNKVNIEPQAVDNIVFQWTPRQINVSNVEYELSIVEIWDDGVDPQTAFLSSPPIFQTTTRSSSFVYGPSLPPLLTDKRYAWQVRAKALQGAEEIGLFRNEGKSEIFWFSRTEPCAVPNGVAAQAQGMSKINVYWEENPALYSEYIIRYREANKPGAQWFTMKTNSGWATVWHLKPGTTYEYQVAGKCKYEESPFSEVQEVTTATEEDESADYNCGIVPDEVAISNRDPHPGLNTGDRITAGDFIITLTEISSQSNGVISGKGFVQIPYLKYARFAVTYEGVLVNTDNQLAQGEVVTVHDGDFGEGEEMTVDVDIDIDETINGDDGTIDSVELDYEIEEIVINENGGIEITGTNGESGTLPGGVDTVITDSEGNTYTVSEDGTITQGETAPGGPIVSGNEGGSGSSVDQIEDLGIRISFKESGTYAYDAAPDVENQNLLSQYPTLPLGEDTYSIIYKAVSKLKGDDTITAEAVIINEDYKLEDVVFKTKEGIKINLNGEWKDNKVELSLQQTMKYAEQEIFATVPSKIEEGKYEVVGTFKLVHLDASLANIKLVLVPINNAQVPGDLANQINTIYNKSGVNFEITTASPLQLPEALWKDDGVFDVGDSGYLSWYSPEENAVIDYYKENTTVAEETYYLFISDLPTNNEGLDGFMPLKSQFGFVFSNSNQGKVAAHELGHGVFGLEHTFKTYGTTEGETEFLMDYGSGTQLTHMDWKQMYADGFKLYWFQGDEDGAAENPYTDAQSKCGETVIKDSDLQYVEKLKELSQNIANAEVSLIEDTINNIENICALKYLDFTVLEKLLNKLIVETSIDDDLEKAILKLLVSVPEEKYSEFHNNILASDDFSALKNLLDRMDDEFAFYGDDNKTYFLDTLANIIAKLTNDVQKWNIVNIIIKESYGNIETREQDAFLKIFSSMQSNQEKLDRLASINLLFTEMLIEDCSTLNDFKIVFEIAEKRDKNQEAFARFTQSDKRKIKIDNYYFEQSGALNWLLPYTVTFKNPYYEDKYASAESLYDWAAFLKYDLGRYNRQDIKNNYLTNHDQTYDYLNKFKDRYDAFIVNHQNENTQFWVRYKGNGGNQLIKQEISEIINHINNYENSESLRKVGYSTMLKVLIAILENSEVQDDLDPVLKNVQSDALMKVAFSVPQGSSRVLREIEKVGLKIIYKNLSGDRLSKFLAWVGQQSIEAKELKGITEKELLDMELASQNDYDSDSILQLESNIFQFDNFSSNVVDKINIKANGATIPYNKEVLVYVADDFTFLGQDFKKGTILNLPMIHAFAISNSNWNQVAENSAWLAADVISFAVGIGGIKILFTTGNIIRKTIVVADVAGSALGALETAMNASALSKETRANIQLISLIASLPDLGLITSKKFDDLVTRTDRSIDQQGGISQVTKSTLKNYLARFKTPEFRASSIIDKIKTTRPNCK
ncbi:fibronectin type III domain-containing protein [Aquimarina brevivitae]|uniref:Fibronectin type III domain protein n=1 Tax=Aquimarina brevivitae TaxID=323412 RepID=A0A4Q7NYW4_9FLAO|nr:fibronectin type III domain-containing protein [Aquimarina brevivitae]RZS92437.1 fibronectin type III domain protein [Aquimarina brevivitae]